MSECRESRGHCYMELIQKDEQSATPIAKASAKCWAPKWMVIRPYFERATSQHLHAGMKVLLKVYPHFHEAYGFSWIVTDIDPTFTLGDMARKRQEIIRQLKEEGVFDLQKELRLPLFCQRIAVISSQTAAGYGDFSHQLTTTPTALSSTRNFSLPSCKVKAQAKASSLPSGESSQNVMKTLNTQRTQISHSTASSSSEVAVPQAT